MVDADNVACSPISSQGGPARSPRGEAFEVQPREEALGLHGQVAAPMEDGRLKGG